MVVIGDFAPGGWISGKRVQMPGLNRDDVGGAERVEQKDEAEDDADDFEWLAFDEHPHDVIDDIKNEPGNKEGNESRDHGRGGG